MLEKLEITIFINNDFRLNHWETIGIFMGIFYENSNRNLKLILDKKKNSGLYCDKQKLISF
jgi:hypothetical protein